MRIIQLIDSLEAGGAERMAVNYANALQTRVEFSGLVCTRKEGLLLQQLHDGVSYLFLRKNSTLDIGALVRLRAYCRNHQITHLQAHATSFFMAVMLKLTLPKLKIIWHDHYGLSEFLPKRRPELLRVCSYFFSGILAVNEPLKAWSHSKLACKQVLYLPNYLDSTISSDLLFPLNGVAGKRILCLANLRPQKNHFLLLAVAELLRQSHPEWSFHLVGQDFEDEYAARLKKRIQDRQLQQQVYVYGTRSDTTAIIQHMDIGVLSSDSEGLPLAVLEYGFHALPVVVTKVGEIPRVVTDQVSGIVVPVGSVEHFYNSLVVLIENQNLRLTFGQALQHHICQEYTEKQVLEAFLNWTKLL